MSTRRPARRPRHWRPLLEWLACGLLLAGTLLWTDLHDAPPDDATDRLGGDWLIDTSRLQDDDPPATMLVQMVDISRIREAEREQTLRFLSHDLRSPQAAILAIVGEARRATDAAAARAGYDAGTGLHTGTLDAIARQAERSLALADGFVQRARADAQPLARAPIDLADLVTEPIDAQWVIARSRGQRIEATGLREGAWIDGDRALLGRVLGNLVDNALKFSPPDSPIGIDLRAGDDAARSGRLTVSDRGPGLRPDEIARLFQPWQRAAATADRPGAGLGLSFVQRVVERHGGRVQAAPREGGGAVFQVELPAAPDSV